MMRLSSRESISRKIGLLGLMAMLSIGGVCAQNQRVAFSDSRMETARAMQAVEQQTGLTFSYNSQLLEGSSPVAFSSTELPLDQALGQMLAGKNLGYTFRNRYIIIHPEATPAAAAVPPAAGRTSDVYRPSSARASGNTAPLRRPAAPVVLRIPTAESAPVAIPREPVDVSAFYSDYKPLSRFAYRGSQLPKLAVKTNLLYAAGTLTPNLALELGLGNQWSLALSGSYNPWNRVGTLENNDKLVHWVVRPELRYWFCETFNGHALSVSPFYNQFNVSGRDIPFVDFDKAYRYEGNAVGLGINYTYAQPIAPRWNVEFSAGVGVALMNYDRFECSLCSGVLDTEEKTYFGPTHLAINLVYLFR